MGNSNGKISAPISLHADVYAVLGLTKTGTYYDTGWVCGNSHGRINKWSKKKPIRYAQPGELTDAQFKGTTADNVQGIYYGLKVASQAGLLGQLHSVNWDYLPPRPGTDWCRLTDFNGYDHNATPTLNGTYTGSSPAYIDADRNFSVRIDFDYQGKNTTGVDIADMLPVTVDENVGDYYPCILIGTYARVLYNTELSASNVETGLVYTPLHHNNVWYTRFFAHIEDLPGVKEQTYQCTVFLIRSVYQAGIFDFRTQWVNVADTMNAYNAFSIPGLINMSIPFKYSSPSYPTVTVTEVNASGWPNASSGFSLTYTKSFTSGTYKFRFSIASPGPAYKEYNIFGSGLNTVVQFTWEEVGILPGPGTSQPSRVSGTVYYVDGSTLRKVSDFDLPVQ